MRLGSLLSQRVPERNLWWGLYSDTQPQSSGIAGAMPDPQDFYHFTRFVHIIVNQVMISKHFAGAGTLFNGLPNKWSLPRFSCAVEQLIADPRCGLRSGYLRQIINDFLEIGKEEIAQDDFVVHCAMRFRACSMEFSCPKRMEHRPASIASSISGVSSAVSISISSNRCQTFARSKRQSRGSSSRISDMLTG